MQTLTLEEVKAAARDHYSRGILQAQNPNEETSCSYQNKNGHRCAVGAALSNDTIAALYERKENHNKFSVLLHSSTPFPLISVSKEEQHSIVRIQNLHDEWMGIVRLDHKSAEQAEKKFLDAIDYVAPLPESITSTLQTKVNHADQESQVLEDA